MCIRDRKTSARSTFVTAIRSTRIKLNSVGRRHRDDLLVEMCVLSFLSLHSIPVCTLYYSTLYTRARAQEHVWVEFVNPIVEIYDDTICVPPNVNSIHLLIKQQN